MRNVALIFSLALRIISVEKLNKCCEFLYLNIFSVGVQTVFSTALNIPNQRTISTDVSLFLEAMIASLCCEKMAGNKRAEEQQIKLRYSLIDSKRELIEC